ncbi:MAG: hypothetical protein Q9162_006244 [Coniocarpon cinnabarinum]
MADVRSLLKEQRSSRHIRHPHAVYTSTGTLSCSLCKAEFKSDAHWEPHVQSSMHAQNLRRARAQQEVEPATNQVSKKRKAGGDEDDANSKRVRSDSIPSRPRTASVDVGNQYEEQAPPTQAPQQQSVAVSSKTEDLASQDLTAAPEEDLFKDEMAAFDREIAELAREEQNRQQSARAREAYDAAPAMSAKPMTAAELAARDREEKSAQRNARDVELEEEREEAAGQMQDEVERMNKLDEKIKELRARKEALTRTRTGAEQTSPAAHLTDDDDRPPHDEDSSSESEDDLDEWAFGKTRG